MDYESLDWESEAKRVMAAFAVTQSCEFALFSEPGRNLIPSQVANPFDMAPLSIYQTSIHVRYTPEMRYFRCVQMLGEGMPVGESEITIDWSGEGSDAYVEPSTYGAQTSAELMQGVYLLGLLTPAIESLLGASVSHHQKMQWLREYEERYGL